jgi:hypothetical protein
MTEKERTEFFQLIRLKLDEIEDIMEAYGGKQQFLSMYCFGVYVPEEDENPDRYEMMAGMHMAMEDEFDLMSSTVRECFEDHIDNPDKGDSGTIDYWLNK